jgi:hypothetical protein
MKKTYINPELEVVKLQTTQMLAASLPVVDPTETVEEINDLLGREAELDFEEEEFSMEEEEF